MILCQPKALVRWLVGFFQGILVIRKALLEVALVVRRVVVATTPVILISGMTFMELVVAVVTQFRIFPWGRVLVLIFA